MTNKMQYLQLRTLDRHLSEIQVCECPSDGWISAIRKSLGMNVRQMAMRIGITQQSAARLEANESNNSITLKSLRKAAEALDCKLVYALIPNEDSLEATVKKQAHKKAAEIVSAVDHTMQLEDQSVGNAREKILEIADDLAKNLNSKLWD